MPVTLRPVGVVFVLFGLFWGAWAVAAIDIERSLGLSVGDFDLLLSVSLIGSAIANVVGGGLCERFGTARIISLALGTWTAFLVFGAVSRPPGLLGLAIVLVVVNAGLIDVTINVASMTALADRPGRLVAFPRPVQRGAAFGAATCGGLLALHISWRWIWVAVAAAALALAVICSRSPYRVPSGENRSPAHRALALLRHERLFVVAGIFALSAMVEGGIDLWGVLFLRSNSIAGLLLGAGGAVLGYTVAAVARTTLGPAIGRRGPPRGVAMGAGVAAVGTMLLATAQAPLMGAIGLVLAAGGISMCWPLLLAAAGKDRPHAAAAVGAVTAGGYVGLGQARPSWVRRQRCRPSRCSRTLAAAAAIVAIVPAVRPNLLIGRAAAA